MEYKTVNVLEKTKDDLEELKRDLKKKKLIQGRLSEDKVIKFLISFYKKNKKKKQ